METNQSFDLLSSDYAQEKSRERVSPSLATCSPHDSSLNKDQISQIDQSIIQVFDQPQTNDDHQNVKNQSETNSRHHSSFFLQDLNNMTIQKNKTHNDEESDSLYIIQQSMTLEQKLQNEIEEQREQLFNAQDHIIKQPSKLKQSGQLYDQIKSSKINKQWERNNYSDQNFDNQSALDVKHIKMSILLIQESSINQTRFQGSILTNFMRKQKSYSDSGQVQGQDIDSHCISNQNIFNPIKRRKYSSDVSRYFNQEGNSVDPIDHYDYSIKCDSESLVAQLNANMSHKVINWNHKNLGDDIWKHLLQLVSRNFELEQIYLGNNLITSEGLKVLGKYLHKFPNLRQVHLNNNKIKHGLNEFGSNAQKCPKLRTINLSCNQIIDQSISQFGIFWENFTNLQTIQFSSNRITAHGLREFLARAGPFPNLHTICLQYNKIQGEGLFVLAINSNKFPKLKIINLEHNEISDDGLKALAEHGEKLPNLQKILLQNNKITSDGLVSIAVNSHKFNSLRTIKLDYNQITDEGLIKFAENGDKFLNMTQFSFNYNKITQNGVKQLNTHIIKFPDTPKIYFEINLFSYYWKFLELIFILVFKTLRVLLLINIYTLLFLHKIIFSGHILNLSKILAQILLKKLSDSGIFPKMRYLCLKLSNQIFKFFFIPIQIYHPIINKLEDDYPTDESYKHLQYISYMADYLEQFGQSSFPLKMRKYILINKTRNKLFKQIETEKTKKNLLQNSVNVQR